LNQILYSTQIDNKEISKTNRTHNKAFFILLFSISTFFIIVALIYFVYEQYNKFVYTNLSKQILNNISITTLYENNNSNYEATRINAETTYKTDSMEFSVIGIIEITSIGINYPIINEFSYELLKIAPCKIAGASPNQIR
jgi:sortase (surface protein transpeptidase)